MPDGFVGAPVRRREDPRLLRGQGKFLDDLRLPGTLHIAFLRSAYAHARLRSIDVAAARELPGVLAVITARDLAGLPLLKPHITAANCVTPGRPLLAQDAVRFVGEPIVVVAAENRYLAEDACELIQVDYEPLPAVVDPERVEQAPISLHEDAPKNVYFHRHLDVGEVDDAFERAAIVIERRFRSARYSGAPIENRGVVAAYEVGSGQLRIWSSTQAPHSLQRVVAECLQMPSERVRVTTPDVGGGFGIKAHVSAEEVVVAWLARRMERPLKWAEDRQEHLQASNHARDTVVNIRAAATREGVVLGYEARVVCDQGAYPIYPYGSILEPLGTAGMIPGPYRVRNYRYDTYAVATNKCPEGAYRGVGMPVASFVHERMMDLVAAEIGLDPAEVRRRNLIRDHEFPYTSVTNMAYESGRYLECLERVLERIDYRGLREQQQALRRQGRYLGLGLGSYVEFTGIGPATFRARGMMSIPGYDGARIVVKPSGEVLVWTSLPAMGQGVETTFAQVVADALGVDAARVVVEPTDTSQAPVGTGCFASRSAVSGGGALHLACASLKQRIAEVAARALEVDSRDLVFGNGAVAVQGAPTRRLTYAEVGAATNDRGIGQGLEASETYDPPTATFANATHAVLVEVDVETGVVSILRYVVAEDCGRIINPMIVDGQVHGAVAQGLGGALLEEMRYDQNGQVLSGSLMDYLIPTAAESPEMKIVHLETPTPLVPGGFKGVGEGGVLGSVPALANAIADALAPFAVEVNQLPASPERIRAWLRAGG